MFRLAHERKVTWPVTVNVPRDGGTVEPCELRVVYTLLGDAELEKLIACYRGSAEGEPKDVLRAHIHGWEDVEDEERNPVPFTPENLERVLAMPYAHAALGAGLIEASRGAPAKN